MRTEINFSNEYDPLAFLPRDNSVSPSFVDDEKTERNLYGVQPEEQSVSRLAFSYLLRVKTNERILLRTPRFRIGKSRERCDYRVEDNTTVSRVHADFLTKNGRIYVMDLGSSNKTFVNGHPIPPQTEVEITHNTKIHLSNEEFVLFTR